MMFDFSFANQLQHMVFELQRMAIGGMVVIMAFSLLRMLLWSLFSLNMGHIFASLSANLVIGALALAVFTQPGLRDAAISYGYALACSLGFGASGSLTGLPGLGGLENMIANDLLGQFNQLLGAFPF
ncbi:MAG: hypothetical protein K6T65_10405 [Peptococcaceae bacterium]|nr:hypothetical protein [Peptococcaceae bacterium]